MNNLTSNIELSNEAALVLFDFLVRFNQKNLVDLFDDPAEQEVLWMLETVLEKELIEPFQNNYTEKLLAARNMVMNRD